MSSPAAWVLMSPSRLGSGGTRLRLEGEEYYRRDTDVGDGDRSSPWLPQYGFNPSGGSRTEVHPWTSNITLAEDGSPSNPLDRFTASRHRESFFQRRILNPSETHSLEIEPRPSEAPSLKSPVPRGRTATRSPMKPRSSLRSPSRRTGGQPTGVGASAAEAYGSLSSPSPSSSSDFEGSDWYSPSELGSAASGEGIWPWSVASPSVSTRLSKFSNAAKMNLSGKRRRGFVEQEDCGTRAKRVRVERLGDGSGTSSGTDLSNAEDWSGAWGSGSGDEACERLLRVVSGGSFTGRGGEQVGLKQFDRVAEWLQEVPVEF